MQSRTTPTATLAQRVVWVVLASAVLLEVVLQVASYVAFLGYSRDPVAHGTAGGATILCIGDSYTYGLGASSPEHTYPSAMGQALKDRGDPAPTVVNAGWPGQNSRDLLTKLEGQLETYAPDLVFILVGVNDSWSRPEALDLTAGARASSDSNWRWRWRTGRLLSWALRASSGSPADPPRAPADAPTGTQSASGGTEAGDDRAPFERGFACLAAGDPGAAVEAFEQALLSQPDLSPEIHQGLVRAYLALDLSSQARSHLHRLEAEHAHTPDQRTTEALVAALASLHENSRAFEVALDGVAHHPASTQLWFFLGEEYHRTWRLALAEQAYDRALECAPADSPVWRANLLRAGARTCYASAPRKSLEFAIQALLLDGDLGKCISAMRPGRSRYSAELARQCLDDLDLAPQDLQAAQQLIAIMLAMTDRATEDDAMGRVLESHLKQMVALCRARGARPILMNYPMPTPQVEAAVSVMGKETGVVTVDMRMRFEEATRGRKEQELFIPDGHCSDAGYFLMGEIAADAATPYLLR